MNEEKLKKNYAFLEEYRQMEMKVLKESIRKSKDEGMKGILKKELLAMVCHIPCFPSILSQGRVCSVLE